MGTPRKKRDDFTPDDQAAYEARLKRRREHYRTRCNRAGLSLHIEQLELLNETLAAMESGRLMQIRDRIVRHQRYAVLRRQLIDAERKARTKVQARATVHELGQQAKKAKVA